MKAFPYIREIESDKEGYKAYAHEDGMNLRDYFAAKAMQAQLDHAVVFSALVTDELTMMDVANVSYQWADAMMEARK